jgi:hypothetical protein
MNAKTGLSTFSALLICGAAGIVVFQQSQMRKAQADVASLNERLRTLREELEQSPASAAAKGQDEQAGRDRRELMRLRAELARLSTPGVAGTKAEGKNAAAPERNLRPTGDAAIDRLFASLNRDPLPEEQPIITKIATKEQDLKSWWEALSAFAQNHGGMTPNSISELQTYLPAGFQGAIDVSGFTFEKGVALSSIPESQIIYKEPNPLALSDGVICNVWLFADGRIDLFQ